MKKSLDDFGLQKAAKTLLTLYALIALRVWQEHGES